MRTKYYFPINSTSLAHYFGCACIKPAKYFENKPEDIQDRYRDFLLITDKNGTQETDCCLEIVFTEQEVEELINAQNGWYLYDVKPLPISRVSQIIFTNREKMQTTITNISMSTAFIPSKLVKYISSFDKLDTNSITIPEGCVAFDQSDEIRKFDRYLGALALMRLAKEEGMSCSEHYIATLSLFNSEIKQQLEYQKRAFISNYQGLFVGNSGFDRILPYLNKTIDDRDLDDIAIKEKQEIRKDPITRLVNINEISTTWTYTIAILNTYGVGNESKKKRVDELISSNFRIIKEGKSEGVALCYGYNRGYSSFTKDYGHDGRKVAVKYELNSQLDYYTIESIYQYVFYGRISNSFPYIDKWCSRLQDNIIKRSTDYKILDTIVTGKKKAKVLSKEYWKQLLPGFLKTFDFLNKNHTNLCEELGRILYDDIKEELKEEFDNKDSANILMDSTKCVSPYHVVGKYKESQDVDILDGQSSFNIKEIVMKTLQYKEKPVIMLKNEAKQLNIVLPPKAKADEIIILLMIHANEKERNLFDE